MSRRNNPLVCPTCGQNLLVEWMEERIVRAVIRDENTAEITHDSSDTGYTRIYCPDGHDIPADIGLECSDIFNNELYK